jgi:hypothetical protein
VRDGEPPRVTGTSPSAGALDALRAIRVTATFTEPVQPVSISMEL